MLNSRQRGQLSGLAQGRECMLTLGRSGASPELVDHLKALLLRHELVKLRFGGFKEARRELAATLAQRSGSEVVRAIGHIVVFWKANPDPEKRVIVLDT